MATKSDALCKNCQYRFNLCPTRRCYHCGASDKYGNCICPDIQDGEDCPYYIENEEYDIMSNIKTWDKFDMAELHSGYVVETRNRLKYMVMRVNQNMFTKILVAPHGDWHYASAWTRDNGDFKGHPNDAFGARQVDRDYDIIRVYGLVSKVDSYKCSDIPNTDDRPLLWERKEPVKLTIEQIRDKFGIKGGIEILIEE